MKLEDSLFNQVFDMFKLKLSPTRWSCLRGARFMTVDSLCSAFAEMTPLTSMLRIEVTERRERFVLLMIFSLPFSDSAM